MPKVHFYKLLVLALLVSACVFSGCTIKLGDKAESTNAASPAASPANPNSSKGGETSSSPKADEGTSQAAFSKKDCENTDVGDHALLKSQTFPVNFAPFNNTCFVTTYNPEFDDPPLESEIAIYRGDKKVYEFDGQFNGVTTGCWVEAVAFQDLNADDLTDIIVVGKCSAKSAPYNENVVYVNTGKEFTTSDTANYELSDLKRAGEIADFVKRNRSKFFK